MQMRYADGGDEEESASSAVDVLILGLGWTSTFLLPQLQSQSPPLSFAGTTRDGRDGTYPFTFDPENPEGAKEQLKATPFARTVLITFPLRGDAAAETLITAYKDTHPAVSTESNSTNYILLGATSIWKGDGWHDETSPYDRTEPRAQAEDYLLSHLGAHSTILDLAGLYGGARHPRNWLSRVAKSKIDVKNKGAVHLVHGEDVAGAIIACMDKWDSVKGKRWILTDGWSYDWWGLFVTFGREEREKKGNEGLLFEEWVFELMEEEGVRGLPRDKNLLGRLMDGRAFWRTVGRTPKVGRLV